MLDKKSLTLGLSLLISFLLSTQITAKRTKNQSKFDPLTHPSIQLKTSIINSIKNFENLHPEIQESIELYKYWTDDQFRENKINSIFGRFRQKQGLLYASPKEMEYRRNIFQNNLYTIGLHNVDYARGKHSYFLKVTKFADLTETEFMERYTQPPQKLKSSSTGLLNESIQKTSNLSPQKPKKSETQTHNLTYPVKKDFRDLNIIGPIEDQGSCGACYSFSSVAATEAAYALRHRDLPLLSLSKQEMVDCGWSTGLGLKGCSGGVLADAYKYLMNYGVCNNSDYKYTAKVGKCLSYKYDRVVKIDGFKQLSANNKDSFFSFLNNQPTSIAIQMLPTYRLYGGGFIDTKGPCGFFYNHGIMAVGYDLDNDGNGGYLILKNTYGVNWGVDGYMYFSVGIGDTGMCAFINNNDTQPYFN